MNPHLSLASRACYVFNLSTLGLTPPSFMLWPASQGLELLMSAAGKSMSELAFDCRDLGDAFLVAIFSEFRHQPSAHNFFHLC